MLLRLCSAKLTQIKRLLIAAPNWAEVRYMVKREVKWKEVRAKLLGLPLENVDAGQELAEHAGRIKVTHKAEAYTGDPKFRAVEEELKVVWL
jgi:hypothetical protein